MMGKINISNRKLRQEFLLIKMNKKNNTVENIYASDDIKEFLRKFK